MEKLPHDFTVIERLHYSPLHSDYVLYCSRGKDERAFCYFDGIEEMPTRIEMFYVTAKEELLELDKTNGF